MSNAISACRNCVIRRFTLLISVAMLISCTTACRRHSAKSGSEDEASLAAIESHAAAKKELVALAIEAIRTRNPVAFGKLIPSAEKMRQLCPQRFEDYAFESVLRRRRDTLKAVGKQVFACADLIDWTDAVQEEVRGGRARDPLKGCRVEIRRLSDLRVRVDANGTRVDVLLKSPYRQDDDLVRLFDAPICRKLD